MAIELLTREQNDDAPSSLRVAVMASPLGRLAITADATAIRRIDWTDADTTAAIDSALLEATVRQLDQYFRDPRSAFDLPLAPGGDPFERGVWSEMLVIPSGATATYGDIAKALGKPAQAVGGACGRNPIPIVIPCHRVVGAGGRMTGYSGKGGVETKRWLLQHEGALLL